MWAGACPRRSTTFAAVLIHRSWLVDDAPLAMPPPGLVDFVPSASAGARPPLVCVDIGSMAEIGMARDWRRLALAVVQTLRARRRRNDEEGPLRLLLLHFPSEVTPAALEAELEKRGADVGGEAEGAAGPGGKKRPRHDDDEQAEEDEQQQPCGTGDLASWVRVLPPEAFVAHAWLLPRCRAVVHHGGLGTTVACVR